MKIYTLFLVIFTSTHHIVKGELKIVTPRTENFKFFTNINDVIFATSSTFQGYEFIFEIPNPSLIFNLKENVHQVYKSFYQNYNYIITEETYANFENTVLSLHLDDNLKVTGKYLLIIERVQNHEVKNYFQLLWSHDIYNVILHTNSSFFTWYPYEKCGDMVVRKTTPLEGFLNKIPKRLNCPLRISWKQSTPNVMDPLDKANPGMSVLHVNLLTKAMGSQSTYGPHSEELQNMMLANRSFDITRHMKERNATLAIGGFPSQFRPDLKFTFENTHFVQQSEFLLVMPLKRVKPKWREFIKSDITTLVLIPTTLIICGILISSKSKISLGGSIFLSWQIFIQLSIPVDPRKVKVRIFLILMLFSMLINFFYLITLSSVFTEPNYEGKIRNMRDFAKTNIPLRSGEQILELVIRYQDKETKKLIGKKFIPSRTPLVEQMKDLDKSNIAQIQVTLDLVSVFKNPKVIEKVQVNSFYNHFMIPLRCHLKEKINYHLREIEERGFRQKFQDLTTMSRAKRVFKEHENVVILTVADLRGVFLVWISGCCFSMVLFVVERVRNKSCR